MVLVLGTGGLLKLPETGYQLYRRLGDELIKKVTNPQDVVFFLANYTPMHLQFPLFAGGRSDVTLRLRQSRLTSE
jgi:hypothetical protein